jgi:hypothetical protein
LEPPPAVFIRSPICFAPGFGPFIRRLRLLALPLALSAPAFFAGCSRFHQQTAQMVYVSARQMYLHDRVAPVSNRVA